MEANANLEGLKETAQNAVDKLQSNELVYALVLILIIGFAVYLGVRFQYVEYEYSFTNGDLDVDKIMAKRKRERKLEINQRQIRVMAPYTAEYEPETKDYKVSEVLDFSSSKNAAA